MFKTITDYFKFIPGQMYFGGAFFFAYWIGMETHYDNLWCFLMPLIYLIYTGNRIIIVAASVGIIAFSIKFFANLNLEQTSYITQGFYFLLKLIFYIRDIYFIWKYRLNAFTYSAKTEKSRKKSLFYAKLGFIFIFTLCLFLYLLKFL